MDYKRKIDFAIKLLRNIPQDAPLEISYSTGKDSDVILELAKMAGIPFEAIYKNTTVDPPGSIAHAKEMGAKIIQPQKSMIQLIEENGWPSRWMRFCCRYLKEYKIHDRAVQGIRRSESSARAKRYKEPEACRIYPNKEKVRIYYPILEWDIEDVTRFIQERGIKCHPRYYDNQGNFHPERRVGCIGCPLAKDKGRQNFRDYPKMLKVWVNAYAKWFTTHPGTKSARTFKNVYDAVYLKLFCDSMAEFNEAMSPRLFPDMNIDARKFLEEYFRITL